MQNAVWLRLGAMSKVSWAESPEHGHPAHPARSPGLLLSLGAPGDTVMPGFRTERGLPRAPGKG